MKRLFIFIIIPMMFSSIVCSAESHGASEHFARGVFCSIDFAPGAAFNERTRAGETNSSAGADLSVGYRFHPQLAIAVGTGAHTYSNKTLTCNDAVRRKVENTCVPVYIRLRSDFLDREVTPYVQMDIGYSFMEMYASDDAGRVKYSQDRFTNGRFEYVEMNDSYIQYGMAGYFASVDLGISLQIIGRWRMNIALCAGIHQVFLGNSFRTAEGECLNFGRLDYLPSGDGEPPVLVRTSGVPDFRDSLDPFARVKIGFSF